MIAAIFRSFILLKPYMFRYWRERKTYRTQMLLTGISALIGVVQFALLGTFLSTGGEFPALTSYGGNIIGFMITGAIGSSMLFIMMNSPKETIQQEQRTGTLELICLSTYGLESVIAVRLMVNFLSSVITSSLMVGVFFYIFHVDVHVNLLALIITITSGCILMSAIGLCAAGYILWSKAGEPFTWFITLAVGLFSGVMFPVEFYPDWLEAIAAILPTTLTMSALRTTTLVETSTLEILTSLVPVFISIAITLPLGICMYRWGLKQARKQGSIGTY